MANPILGSWQLISMTSKDHEGNLSYPMGENPIGIIMYNETTMSAILSCHHNDLDKDLLHHVSYAGTYDAKDGKAYHHVSVSSEPTWPGRSLERNFSITNDILKIWCHEKLNDQEFELVLIWKKIT
jgi:hypothetical protein